MRNVRPVIFVLVCLFAGGALYAQERVDLIDQALDSAQQKIAAENSLPIDVPFSLLLGQGQSAVKVFPKTPGTVSLPENVNEMIAQYRAPVNDFDAPEDEAAPVLPLDSSMEEETPEVDEASFSDVSAGQEAVIDSLQLKNMDILDVLKLLSQKTGMNIIAGKNVKGEVTIYLTRVKLRDALRIILDANNLAYQEEDGIIRVMEASEFEQRYGHVFGGKYDTRMHHLKYVKAKDMAPVLEQIKSSSGKIITDEKSNTVILIDTPDKIEMMTRLLEDVDLPLEVAVFDLNYAKAEELVKKIEPLLTEGIGNVKYDERSNKIVLTDVADKIQEIGSMIGAFDVREQQVLIEAKIVQITLTDSYQLGVNWRSIFAGLDDVDASMDFDVISATEANRGKITVGTIANDNYTAMVEALQKVGETNILSNPSITAISNQEAKIIVGSTQPYVTTTTTIPSSGPTSTAESVSFIEVGVKLYVTPTVHKDGFITMKIRPEVSSVVDTLETSQENEIPIVETSEAETIVRIKDGVTIVIGGLIKDSLSTDRGKVPVLGDIPLLGAAFRNRDDSNTKTEIAIFLTPHIISGEENHPADPSIVQEEVLPADDDQTKK